VFKFIKSNYQILLISIFTYLVFFWKLLLPSNVIYSGKDSIAFHYPSRVYLYNQLKSGVFPFWTENMFLGYPLYGDMERGYLNPINLLLVNSFGPFDSYKILHFFCYLIGSFSLYIFLKKYGVNTWGFLVSNAIYFFSFFSLYHQQHFNMVLTYYLFPLGLVFLDYLITSNKLRYAVFNALLLTYCFYMGSFQFVFLFILLELFYLNSNIGFSKKLLFYGVYTLSLFLILCLPGIFSTYNLYKQSERDSSIEYTQGAYSSVMFVNTVFPLLFNFGDSYMGSLVSSDYFMHEVYTYVGVTTLIFSILGYFMIKDKKLKKFINTLLIIFLVLSSLKYIPILNAINIFPFSLFRYWVRSVVFLNLSLSVLLYVLIANIKKLSVPKILTLANIKTLSYPLLYLFILGAINIFEFGFKGSDVLKVLHVLYRGDYVFGYWYYVWLLFLALSLIVLFIKKLQKSYVIGLLVLLDLIFFGLLATKGSMIKDIDTLHLDNISSKNINSRQLDLSGGINGDNALLSDSWNVFGYSVLYPSDVAKELKRLGFTSLRYPTLDNYDLFDQNKLMSLGISKLIYSDGRTAVFPNNTLIKNSIELGVDHYTSESGHLSFDVVVSNDTLIETYVRNYVGWEVLVDGMPISFDGDTLFINFSISKGFHNIVMHFVPTDLFDGLEVSILLLAVFYSITLFGLGKKKWKF